jgi:hypothetical protein
MSPGGVSESGTDSITHRRSGVATRKVDPFVLKVDGRFFYSGE